MGEGWYCAERYVQERCSKSVIYGIAHTPSLSIMMERLATAHYDDAKKWKVEGNAMCAVLQTHDEPLVSKYYPILVDHNKIIVS